MVRSAMSFKDGLSKKIYPYRVKNFEKNANLFSIRKLMIFVWLRNIEFSWLILRYFTPMIDFQLRAKIY